MPALLTMVLEVALSLQKSSRFTHAPGNMAPTTESTVGHQLYDPALTCSTTIREIILTVQGPGTGFYLLKPVYKD